MEEEICVWCPNAVSKTDTTCMQCGMPINREKYVGLDFFMEICELSDKVFCYEKNS